MQGHFSACTYLIVRKNVWQGNFPVANGRVVEKEIKQQRIFEDSAWGAMDDGAGTVVQTMGLQELCRMMQANGAWSRRALNSEANTAIR